MNTKIFGGVLAIALAITSVAQAQTRTPRINHKEQNQERRINRGVRSGQLTRNEAHSLRHGERRVGRDKRMAKADGRVTRGERRHLRREQNHMSHAIYHDKHNARVRA